MTNFYDEVTAVCNDWYQGWISIFNEEKEFDLKQDGLLLGTTLCMNPATAPFGFAVLMNHFSTDIKEFFTPVTEFFKEWISGWEDMFNTEIDIDAVYTQLENISSATLKDANNAQKFQP